jgi:hypothetical protein
MTTKSAAPPQMATKGHHDDGRLLSPTDEDMSTA